MLDKSIEIFPWNENFNTGIDEIDEQHGVLVKLLNRLALQLTDHQQPELLEDSFNKLADYAIYHFQCEERIWETFFPKSSFFSNHRDEHNDFISTVSDFKKGKTTNLHELTEELISFLVKWLAEHILETDMRMAKMALAMQSGLSLESAQKEVEKEMSGVLGAILDTTLKMYEHLCQRTLQLANEFNKVREAADALRLYSRVFSDTHEGIIITDPSGIIVEVNAAFCKITGYSREEAVGQNPSILNSGRQDRQFYVEMWQSLLSQGWWQGEVWSSKKCGTTYAELLTISASKDSQGNLLNYVGIFSDITHSKEQQKKLEIMAHYDALTNLPNRTLFYDRFIQAVAHSKRSGTLLAVCFLDLDDFKPVNDEYGHNAGDQLLIEVAERITKKIREEDTVSRVGGDEFTLLIGGLDSFTPCERLLKRILSEVSRPYLINGHRVNISASLGVAVYPQDDSDLDTLVRHADHAMYQAKLEGKNRFHLFAADHELQVGDKFREIDEIQQALLNEEFRLYYQPKLNMKTGEVYGVEALIRWQHPEKGIILPLKFLPVIEGTEIEIQLGEWVIQQALEQTCLWNRQKIRLEVSVNIGSYHLKSASFVNFLEQALLKQPEVNPSQLQLEILESSELDDVELITNVIRNFQERFGVKIALDDFGTSYSSLAHLRNIPVDTIKIDRSFIKELLDDVDDYIITRGTIGLAASFERGVIAEGVETIEQGLMLSLMGCGCIQGYALARPMPAGELPKWLAAYVPNQAWITSANTKRNRNEARLEILSLLIKQWEKRFERSLLSPPSEEQIWPLMAKEKCPSSRWFRQEKFEKLFDEAWLSEFGEILIQGHSFALTLKSYYHEDELGKAREGLPQLKNEFVKIHDHLAVAF